MTQKQAVSIETLKAILEAFNAHDLDAILEFFAEDCTLDMPRGPEAWGLRYTGKAAVREGLAARFRGRTLRRRPALGERQHGRLGVAADRHFAG
ncbi:MAG TPA: nuclear transport factor 2 family protein [Gammaproteobacteria bacterium]|nr:nuclear transport factor 2 family protein [Gammaproteobacteria bacterium]